MKTFEKLVIRLKELFGEDLEVYHIKSLHSGPWQKQAGAWSWFAYTSSGTIGSSETATELIKCQRIGFISEPCGDFSIYSFTDTGEDIDYKVDE